MPTSPCIASVSPLWKVGLRPAWSPGVVERLTDNGCIKPGSPQAHEVACSQSLLVDAALGQGVGARAGFHGASTALGRDRDKVRHRCQLWALLYNSAESEATLPALPSFIPKERGGAQTTLASPVTAGWSTISNQALTESMVQSVPARSRCTRALGWARKL